MCAGYTTDMSRPVSNRKRQRNADFGYGHNGFTVHATRKRKICLLGAAELDADSCNLNGGNLTLLA